MDPDATLIELRRLAEALLRQIDHTERPPTRVDTSRLCELVRTLDDWVTSGGFLPASWERGQQAAIRRGERSPAGNI